jgi:nucleotide-binding universal stress UspA family protein
MKIVVPLDLSETSSKAIRHAADIAAGLGDEVVLVVVNGSRLRADVEVKELAESEHTDIADLIEAYLKSSAADIEGVPVSYATLGGVDAAESLIEFVAGDDIRMIVMATHGRTGLDKWRMGSVTERVVRHSTAPVLVVPTRRPS